MFSTRYNKVEKLWYGPQIPPLYNPSISVAQAVLNSMQIFGPKIAQISDNNGTSLTFNEMKMKTIRAAQNLQALGLQQKQVFSIIARNSDNVAPIVFASIAIGCPLNALDPSFGKTELIHMLNLTKPVLMFCDNECYELVNECLSEVGIEAKIFTFGGAVGRSKAVESLFKETFNESHFTPVKVDGPNEAAMILCSSGTTGLPKGVCLSHAAMLDVISRFGLNFTDVALCFSSLYWASGVVTLLRSTLIGATRIITNQTFSPELQIRLIEQYKVTFTLNAPHQIILMLKCDRFRNADLSSMKCLLVGGSKVPHFIKNDLVPRLPNGYVVFAYGLSETFGPIFFDYPVTNGKDTVGRAMGGCSIKIVDDNGRRCEANVDGEICIKMTYNFLGYYGNPQSTQNAFDEEDFILTGDVGHFDEDGDLFVTGRQKELLKYCNFPIAPAEIDTYLSESPDIKAACVVGIPDPMGDLPAAVIIRAEGSNVSEENVFDMVAGHFADHCKLRGGVYFVDAFPTTPSGKVLRKQVQATAIELFNVSKA